MSRVPGYAITVKLFIPAPRNDFKAQAAAATIVAAIVADRVLTPELVSTARVISADGKFSSMEALDPNGNPGSTEAPANQPGEEPSGEVQSDETAVEGVKRAGRSRG